MSIFIIEGKDFQLSRLYVEGSNSMSPTFKNIALEYKMVSAHV